MSDEENTPVTNTPSAPVNFDNSAVYTARVKWFNNRSGYGFATVSGGDRDG